ncbi:MAG: hypothetical protein ACR2PV_05295 [Gammaproteobacteria bacterium]
MVGNADTGVAIMQWWLIGNNTRGFYLMMPCTLLADNPAVEVTLIEVMV